MSDLQNDNYGQNGFRNSWDSYNGGNPPWKKTMDDILAEQEAEKQEKEETGSSQKAQRKKNKKNNKTKKKKKRRKKNYFLRFIIILSLIVGTIVFLSSDFFAINIIMVENNEHFTDEEIIQMSGINTKDNLIKIKKSSIRKKLIESPYIDHISVYKRLPQTLIIDVKEREAVMAFQIGQKYVITDKDGLVMEVADSTQGATLMSTLKPTVYDVGETVTFDDPIVWKQMLALAQEMADSGMYFKKLEYRDPLVRGHVLDGLIFQGLPKSLADNMEAIKVILYELNQMSITRGIVNIGEDGYAAFSPDVGSETDQSVQGQIQKILDSKGITGSDSDGKETSSEEDKKEDKSDENNDLNNLTNEDSGTGNSSEKDADDIGTADGNLAGSGTSLGVKENTNIQSLGDLRDLIHQLAEKKSDSAD